MSATFTVVTLDGQEHSNLDTETVKEWFLKKRLREDSFVMASESGEWKLLKKVFDVSMWLAQNFNHAPYQPQPLFPAQPQMPQAPPQQPVYQQQQAYPQPMPQQQAYPQPMPQQQAYSQPVPQQQYAQPQPQYYPQQQEANQYYQQQQQYQPQQQWVSQQNWVAPPPPVQSFAQRMVGVFESASGRAKAAIISLKVILLTSLILGLFNFFMILSPPDMKAMGQGQINPATVMFYLLAGIVGLLHIAIFVVTVVLFLMWLHRAYKNLQSFGVPTESTPGWAVGYWFIPFVNLVRPYNIMKELFDKSESIAENFRCNTQETNSALVGFWWACYLLSGLISWIANKGSYRTVTPEELSASAAMDVVSAILSIISGVIVIKLIKSINQWQEDSVAVSTQSFQQQNHYGY